MAIVDIGPPLRRYCDGKAELEGDGRNVIEVLSAVSRDYPELRSRILKSETEISARMFVYREDDGIIQQDRETAPVAQDGRLRLYVFVGGG